ncbi:MAG: nuclear transport factor 2 family protein [Rhodanobacter sp.]
MEEHEKRQLIEQYIAAYNRRDVDGMMALLTPDVQFKNISAGQINASARGMVEFRELAQHGEVFFSDRAQSLLALKLSSSSAVATIDYRSVLAVDMPEGPKAGSVIKLSGESEFWFENGRISHLIDRS